MVKGMKTTVIKHATLIDGLADEPVADAYLVIEGDTIRETGTGSPPFIAGAEEIDASGQYVLPGLIDSHVHLIWDGSPHPQSVIAQATHEEITLRAYRHALQYLAEGITTVRDLSSPGQTVLQVRNAIRSGLLAGPTIVSSGPAICMTGGHVYYIGTEADGEDEVRKTARTLLKQGVDCIKLMATGGIYTNGEQPGSPQLNLAEIRAAKEEALHKNRKVAAHAQGLEGIENCLEAGIDTIEHGIFANEAALRRMIAQGTFLVPTIVIMRNLAKSLNVPRWANEKVQHVLEPHFSMLEQAVRLGVTIAVGTDCGSPETPPPFYFDELLAYEEAGMSRMQVLKSATSVAAACCDLPDRGVLAAGYKADVILVSSNPLDDLNALRERKRVWKDGRLIGSLPV
jgi:imidazolonepropionase-like amidohydrolase